MIGLLSSERERREWAGGKRILPPTNNAAGKHLWKGSLRTEVVQRRMDKLLLHKEPFPAESGSPVGQHESNGMISKYVCAFATVVTYPNQH